MKNEHDSTILTAGSNYLDIDAYACAVAMADLLNLQGANAIAYSQAPCNYSVCSSLTEKSQLLREIPKDFSEQDANYIIVDVSDPVFLKSSVPLDRVIAVYDHHIGFEEYWRKRIGDGVHIEFIGAAATLIYREWKKEDLQNKMSRETALLLIAAILDNTLNLTSANTTEEDRTTFRALCAQAGVGDGFRALYFSEVQNGVEKRHMNILITGAKGFVGRNLTENLKNIRDGKNRTRPNIQIGEIYEYDIDSTAEELDEYCAKADFVFNLAGVNRPKDPAEFKAGNFGFASTLLDTLKKHHNTCPVMLSSSIQATLAGRFGTSEYGLSKRAGEDLFFSYAEETGAKVLVYRFPNLVGKWVKPNYNSAVGTFCNNIANDLPITVGRAGNALYRRPCGGDV